MNLHPDIGYINKHKEDVKSERHLAWIHSNQISWILFGCQTSYNIIVIFIIFSDYIFHHILLHNIIFSFFCSPFIEKSSFYVKPFGNILFTYSILIPFLRKHKKHSVIYFIKMKKYSRKCINIINSNIEVKVPLNNL